MKRSVLTLIVVLTSIMFSLPLIGDDNKKNPELAEQFVSTVTSILQGQDIAEFKKNISPEAYVISNNTYESAFEVLGNPSKKERFIEGKEVEVGYFHLWISDDPKNAYLVLQTKNELIGKTSWHTIFLKVGGTHKWQILSWHKS